MTSTFPGTKWRPGDLLYINMIRCTQSRPNRGNKHNVQFGVQACVQAAPSGGRTVAQQTNTRPVTTSIFNIFTVTRNTKAQENIQNLTSCFKGINNRRGHRHAAAFSIVSTTSMPNANCANKPGNYLKWQQASICFRSDSICCTVAPPTCNVSCWDWSTGGRRPRSKSEWRLQ